MDEQAISERLNKIESRLDFLEGKKSRIKHNNEDKSSKKNYSGLAGGIRFLIDKQKFNQPRSVAEIFEELKKENYHYPKKSVEKLLSVNFMKKSKILNRIKEDKKWKYVVRK